MTTHIIKFRGRFEGIYAWGEGWDMEKRELWYDFWKYEAKGIFWKFITINDGVSSCDYLVSTGGSIYLHPMIFDGGLFDCGCNVDGRYFNSMIKELNRLCNECAEYCGAKFTFETSDEIAVEYYPRIYSTSNI